MKGVKRFLRWQFAARLMPFPIVVPFVEETFFVMERGMTGATGNYYTGLDEYADMAFLLHFLREGDLFCDIGANIGSFTLLASGVVGARTFSFEPVPITFDRLKRNIDFNGIGSLVKLFPIGLSDHEGSLQFVCNSDSTNHVATEDEKSGVDIRDLEVRKLDNVLEGEIPNLMKIDVEGWESSVLSGATEILKHKNLNAIIIETNDCNNRYNQTQNQNVTELLEGLGFRAFTYNPFSRTLELGQTSVNTIFIRDVSSVQSRILSSRQFTLPNGCI